MTTLHLEAGYEKQAPQDFKITGLQFPQHPLLYHQMRTYEALPNFDLVCNTYNTGTGKTLAALLHLFRLNGTGKNVLFIAPTNALLQQHADDIREFVHENELDFYVKRVTAAEVHALRGDLRSGDVLQRLIRNYLEFDPEATRRQQLILVVNPDIFYYALYSQYNVWDQRNVFEQFLTQFDYVVIDEFHYYDSKQLANFLFFFAICQQFGYFSHRARKICLLSATPTEEVMKYFGRLFDDRWVLVAPDNEPSDSDGYPRIQTLAPLELTVVEDAMQDWVGHHRDDLQAWLNVGQDGAIISSALWRVNEAHRQLRSTFNTEKMRRITGPEPEEKRVSATRAPLVPGDTDGRYRLQLCQGRQAAAEPRLCDLRCPFQRRVAATYRARRPAAGQSPGRISPVTVWRCCQGRRPTPSPSTMARHCREHSSPTS